MTFLESLLNRGPGVLREVWADWAGLQAAQQKSGEVGRNGEVSDRDGMVGKPGHGLRTWDMGVCGGG